MGEGYLTTGEAARQLGVCRRTLLRAIGRGEVPSERRTCRGIHRLRAADVAAYAARRTPVLLSATPGETAAPVSGNGAASASVRRTRRYTEANLAVPAPPSASVGAGFARLAALAPRPGQPIDDLIAAILRLVAESLGVGLTFLARVDGDALYIERVHDRAGMGLAPGVSIPLCDTYCRTLLDEALAGLVVEDSRSDPDFAARATTRALGIGAYSGVSFRRANGAVYGTLCTLHPSARSVEEGEVALLALAGRLIAGVADAAASAERAEKAAAELAAVIAHIPDGVIVLDAAGRPTLFNEAGRRIAGAPAAEAPRDRPIPDYAAAFLLRDAASGRALAPAQTPLARALAGETITSADLLSRHAGEAHDRCVRASAVPLRNDAGAITGAVGVFADVTAERRLLQAARAVEGRLRATYAAMACGVVVWGADGAVLEANAAAEGILGVSGDELRGRLPADRPYRFLRADGSPLSRDETPSVVALRTGQPQRGILIGIARPDETRRWLYVDAVPVEPASADNAGTDGPRVIVSFVDATAQVEAERRARATDARLQRVVADAPLVLFALDPTGVFTLFEGSGLAVLGLRPGQAVGRSALDIHHDRPDILAYLHRALAGEAHTAPFELNGAVFETRYTPLLGADGAVTGVIGVGMDITERARTEEALRASVEDLRHQATHDALTDLPNRTLLRDRLNRALRHARRKTRAVALLLLDLDRFKDVNDTFGHQHGDLLLREVGARLRDVLRASDTVARLGGDEFAVLLPDADAAGAARAAEVIDAALNAPFIVGGQVVHIGASVGIAVASANEIPQGRGNDAPEALLRQADIAMYAAKRRGAPYAFYALDQDEYTPERLALIEDFRTAIAGGALQLHYQPKVDLATGQVVGVEALARWAHPTRGAVAPSLFIPLAEGAGLMTALTRWALGEAARQAAAWASAGHPLPVAVNLSAAGLHDPELPDILARSLDTHNVPAALLRLEVTEGALMVDPVRAGEVLTRMAAAGVGVSVDDYGTGYSSLTYLKHLPADELKIDMSFVRHMASDAADAAIVRSTVELGHNLGLRVVAEGVEDKETLDLLVGMGCDVAQGYYVARPLPADEMEQWLRGSAWAA